MVTNLFFNNFNFTSEQNLIDDLIIEAIKIYGIECYYLPRTLVKEDNLFGEDTLSKFDRAFALEMYIKNVEGFEGEGDFLSKFNIEIRDEMTLTVSRRRFSEEIHPSETTPYNEDQGIGRPAEGDLIWFPLNGKIFEVKFVEHEAVFYQLGSLQTYDLRCELFEYSSERIDTGIPQIDAIETTLSVDALLYQILFETYTTAAVVSSTVSSGSVTAINVVTGGQDYTEANTTVTIQSPTVASGARVSANGVGTIEGGRLTAFEVTIPGGYYSSAPGISFARPNTNYFVNAAAEIVADINTNITDINVSNGGFFYATAPIIEFPEPNALTVSAATLDRSSPKIGNTAAYVSQNFFSFTQRFTQANLQYGTLEVFVKPDTGSNTGLVMSTNAYSVSIANGALELKSYDGTVFNRSSNGSFVDADTYTHVLLEANSSHTLVFQDGVNVINVATDNSNRPLVSGIVALGDFRNQSNGIIATFDGLKISNTSPDRLVGDIHSIDYPKNTIQTDPEFTLTIANGVITDVDIVNGGSYFASKPTLTVSAPGLYNDTVTGNTEIASATANATVTVANRLLDAVTISNTGFYYSSVPTISLTGGGAPEFKFGNSSEKLPSSRTDIFVANTTIANSSIDFWLHIEEALPTVNNQLSYASIVSGNNFNIGISSVASNSASEFGILYSYIRNDQIVQIDMGDYYGLNTWHHINISSLAVPTANIEFLVLAVNGTRIAGYASNIVPGSTQNIISNQDVYSIGPRNFASNTSITFGQANGYIDALHFSNTAILVPNAEISTYTVPTSEYTGGQFTNNFNFTSGTLQASLTEGKVTNIAIISSGNNYYEAPTIEVSAPDTSQYRTANIVVATTENNGIASVTIVDGGFGYITDNENTGLDMIDVTITSSNTSSWYLSNTTYYTSADYYNQLFIPFKASGTANVNSDGTLNAITLSNTGFGYLTGQSLIIPQPNTAEYSTATANSTINANGEVVSVTVISGGLGYANANALFPAFTPPTYVTATAVPIIVGGAIESLVITNPGSGYRSPPIVTIIGNQQDGSLLSEDGGSFILDSGQIGYKPENTDSAANNTVFESHSFIDFSESNPFSEGGDW